MLICAAHLAECSKLFVNEWMLDVHRYSTACPNIWNHVLLSPHLENRHAPCLRIYSQYGVKMCIISQIHGFILFIFLALLSGFRLIRFAAKNLRIVENIIPSLVLTLLFFVGPPSLETLPARLSMRPGERGLDSLEIGQLGIQTWISQMDLDSFPPLDYVM